MTDFFVESKAYVEFGVAEAKVLHALHDVLAPHFRRIAELFYTRLLGSDSARRVFRDEAQVARLKETLVEWMASGLLGPHDDRFYERRSRIGRRHVAIGLQQHYMFTAMNVVRTEYQRLVFELVPAAQWHPTLTAVHRLLDLELMLMLRHYQLDSEERLLSRERHVQAEKLTAVQTLSAGLAHEVRNPLNAAALQLELLHRRIARAGDDPKLAEPTRLVHVELQRLSRMLNEFMSFARPPQLDVSDHDLVAVVKHVLEAERVYAHEHGVELLLMSDDTPAIAEVDAGKVHQIAQNLVRNAVEASPRGEMVEVRVGPDGDFILFEVRDRGAGIPDETRKRMFEPFFSTKESGTGLGMAIVHSLIVQHRATLEVDTSSRGSIFRARFLRRTVAADFAQH